MVDFGKMIDKLIEISTNVDISQEVQFKLDEVIDELIHLEIEKNDNRVLVPDFNDLSPEEMEEIKLFEMFVRDVMNDDLAMA
jgi:type II secretory pathway predicted ATPase ExeA